MQRSLYDGFSLSLRRHVIRMCLKCADLSHALVDWNQHFDWSLRVAEEFYQQVRLSRQYSLL